MVKTVYIERNSYDEFEVRAKGAPEVQTYFTPDRDDAVGTARLEHGPDCKIVFRRKREVE